MLPTPRQLAVLTLIVALAAQAGCRWNAFFRQNAAEPPPIAFAALPTAEETAAAINANTGRVQTLQTQGATVAIPGFPSITAEIAAERPGRLRFRASAPLLGPQLDLGSNDQLFWIWSPALPQSAVYFARHEQFAASRARQMFALEPAWLVQALGLVEVDPAGIIEGPITAGNDRVSLRTTLPSAAGQYTRQIVLHARYGWVLEQHVFDSGGQLIASSRASNHEYSAIDGVSLPKHLEIQMPQSQLQFQLDIDRWGVNQPLAQGAEIFELPREALASHPFLDLADPTFVAPIPATASHVQDSAAAPRVRGLGAWR